MLLFWVLFLSFFRCHANTCLTDNVNALNYSVSSWTKDLETTQDNCSVHLENPKCKQMCNRFLESEWLPFQIGRTETSLSSHRVCIWILLYCGGEHTLSLRHRREWGHIRFHCKKHVVWISAHSGLVSCWECEWNMILPLMIFLFIWILVHYSRTQAYCYMYQ